MKAQRLRPAEGGKPWPHVVDGRDHHKGFLAFHRSGPDVAGIQQWESYKLGVSEGVFYFQKSYADWSTPGVPLWS